MIQRLRRADVAEAHGALGPRRSSRAHEHAREGLERAAPRESKRRDHEEEHGGRSARDAGCATGMRPYHLVAPRALEAGAGGADAFQGPVCKDPSGEEQV